MEDALGLAHDRGRLPFSGLSLRSRQRRRQRHPRDGHRRDRRRRCVQRHHALSDRPLLPGWQLRGRLLRVESLPGWREVLVRWPLRRRCLLDQPRAQRLWSCLQCDHDLRRRPVLHSGRHLLGGLLRVAALQERPDVLGRRPLHRRRQRRRRVLTRQRSDRLRLELQRRDALRQRPLLLGRYLHRGLLRVGALRERRDLLERWPLRGRGQYRCGSVLGQLGSARLRLELQRHDALSQRPLLPRRHVHGRLLVDGALCERRHVLERRPLRGRWWRQWHDGLVQPDPRRDGLRRRRLREHAE